MPKLTPPKKNNLEVDEQGVVNFTKTEDFMHEVITNSMLVFHSARLDAMDSLGYQIVHAFMLYFLLDGANAPRLDPPLTTVESIRVGGEAVV
jgi:hypothetical protein